MSLNREILKWLQALDLSYSVRNVKRDFSNGFLIAEIFSRYFPQELQMHSFDNGTSLPKKLANWELLERFFKRRRVPLNREQIDNVIHCKDGAAVPMLETIYTCLTNKKVVSVRPRNDEELIPPFARATATQMIRENIKDSELTTTLTDEVETSQRARAVLESHRETLKHEKQQDPSRFAIGGAEKSPKPPQTNKPISLVQSSQQHINFKEVQVRTLDRSIAQIRASKQGGGGGVPSPIAPLSATGGGGGGGIGSVNNNNNNVNASGNWGQGGGIRSSGEDPMTPMGQQQQQQQQMGGGENGVHYRHESVKPLIDIVTDIARELLGTKAEWRLLEGQGIQLPTMLVEQVMKERIGSHVLVHLFSRLTQEVGAVADACASSPKDFYYLISWFAPLFARFDIAAAADAHVAMLTEVGMRLRATDPFMACGLFCDYGLVKIAPVLSRYSSRREPLLALFYQFVEPPQRLVAVKALQDILNDLDLFVTCLSYLICFENDFSEDLLDLYVYYAVLGLGSESPSLRASCLTMLADIAGQFPEVILPLLPKLEEMIADTWWEVASRLLVCLCRLLERLEAEEHPAAELCDMATRIILCSRSALVSKVAIACMSPVVWRHAALRDAYKQCILQLTARELNDIVGASAGGGATTAGGHGPSSNALHQQQQQQQQHPSASGTAASGAGASGISGGAGGKRAGVGSISSSTTAYDALKIPLKAAQVLSAKVTEMNLQHFESEQVSMIMVLAEDPIEGDDVVEWKDVFLQLKDYLFVSLCDEEFCHRAARAIYSLVTALADAAFESFGTFASSLQFVFEGESKICQEVVLQLLKDLSAAGEPLDQGMQDLAAKCGRLWNTPLRPWMQANGVTSAPPS